MFSRSADQDGFFDCKSAGSQRIPGAPHAEFAKLLGLTGIHCDDPSALPQARDQALAATGPVVLEVAVDPGIPPVVPHIQTMIAKKIARAVVEDPDRVGNVTKGTQRTVRDIRDKTDE
ncbi:MAG TPA: hypothetical protein VFR27_19855 [Mycobacterium sp.]|nr:hypothetical protein [Mycobacterium sp.]